TAGVKPSFERRAECIKRLVDAGFADKLFLSSDSEFGGSLLPEQTRDWRENMDPSEGMLFITSRLLTLAENMHRDTRDFVDEILCHKFASIWVHLSMEAGLILEAHGQDLMLALSS